MRRWVLIIFLSLVVGVFVYLSRHGEGLLHVGDPAPAFSLKDYKGDFKSLSDYQGHPVLLHFWATWCPSCLEELNSLNRLRALFSEDQLVILGVSLDEGGWEQLSSFFERIPVHFQVLLDLEGVSATAYGVHILPTSYLIDARGKVLESFVGPQDWTDSQNLARFKSLLPSE